jgi:hypothetical protein
MCGIAAFLPKNTQKVDKKAIISLAIGNEERGTDNSGISVGKWILKGGKELAKFRNLYVKNKEEIDTRLESSEPMILHTRRSTTFVVDNTYAHPFMFHTKDDKQYLVGCHNGIITNKEQLGFKFCPNVSKGFLTIDSEYALYSLFLGKKEEVLKYYEGDAAFIFYTNEGFYAWKGANNNVEERTLYYVERPEGWYFASTFINLVVVFDEIPMEVPNNTLLKFSLAGELILSKKIERVSYSKAASVAKWTDTKRNVNGFYVDSKGHLLDGEYHSYTIDRISWVYFGPKTSNGSYDIIFVKGVPVRDKAIWRTISLSIRNAKTFDINQFIEKHKERLKNCYIIDMPIYVGHKHRYILKQDAITKEFTVEDLNIKPIVDVLPTRRITNIRGFGEQTGKTIESDFIQENLRTLYSEYEY